MARLLLAASPLALQWMVHEVCMAIWAMNDAGRGPLLLPSKFEGAPRLLYYAHESGMLQL